MAQFDCGFCDVKVVNNNFIKRTSIYLFDEIPIPT